MTTGARQSVHGAVLTMISASAFACTVVMAEASGAQSRSTGMTTIRGVVYDSLSSRMLSGALVEIANLPHTVMTDAKGRFRLDSVPAGTHRLTFSAPTLDSIGLFAFASDVEAGRGDGEREVRLATPSFRTMYARLCAPVAQPPRDSAIVFGTVRDAESGAIVGDASVVFAWPATGDGSGSVQLDATRRATSGSDGAYGVCGLPAQQRLRARASTDRAESVEAELFVGDVRIAHRDLVIRPRASPVVSSADPAGDSAGVRVRALGIDRVRFLGRKQAGKGFSLEKEAFGVHNEMGSILMVVPGLTVTRDAGQFRFFASGTNCHPVLVLDGEQTYSPDDALKNLRPRDVMAVEYYYGPQLVTLPKEYLRGAAGCGVLLIWTKAARW